MITTRGRRRSVRTVALAGAVCGLLAGCASTVTGLGSADVPAPVATAPASGRSAPTSAAGLDALLESPPQGSRPWATAWSDLVNPTPTQYAQHVFPTDSTQALTLLHDDGLVRVAHRTWVAGDHNQADLILMQFTSATGADRRYDQAVAAVNADPTERTVPLPGSPGDEHAYRVATVDGAGNIAARVYAHHDPESTIVVEIFYFSPKTFSPGDMYAWLAHEVSIVG